MKTNPNDCAFPADYRTQSDGGLTKREYIAAGVLQGIVARGREDGTWEQDVTISVRLTDILIEELNKQESKQQP